MNPTMAEDIDVLEQYLTPSSSATAIANKPYSVVSSTPGKPMIYLTVPRWHRGLHSSIDPRKA